ncbi:MAG: hypothetical protein K6F05_09000 [Succinivibrio sp.]|nr:hypothetical protein [Succinivibrio sp.]
MRKLSLILLLLCSLILSTSCTLTKEESQPQDSFTRSDYQSIIEDASSPSAAKLKPHLLLLKGPGQDPRQEWLQLGSQDFVLVATMVTEEVLKFWQDSAPFTVKVDCFVTVPGELAEQRADFAGLEGEALRRRLIQKLGLSYTSQHDHVVLFYADRRGIIRPAFNPDPASELTELSFPAGTSDTYIQWFDEQKRRCYSADPPFPFTQLGYTYDWGSPDKHHFGLSEFVVLKGTKVKVKAILSYADYIRAYAQ